MASLIAFAGEPITVSAVGDLMLGTTYPGPWLPADQAKGFLKAATPYIKAADIRFGNLEGTLFEGRPQPDGKSPGPNRYLFRSPIDYVERFVDAGFNVMSLANNHAMDFGNAGIQSTRDTLALARIQSSSKRGDVAKFEIRGTKVALIAADYYKGNRSLLTPQSTFEEIESLKKEFDIVIVSAHAGGEGVGATRVSIGKEIFLGENRGDSVSFARQAIDAGADLILMHGPHVPRGMETYRNRLIVYSLGNFATAKGIAVRGVSALAPLVQIQLDSKGQLIKGRIVSFEQKRPEETVLDAQAQVFHLIKRLSHEDFPKSHPQFLADGFFKLQ